MSNVPSTLAPTTVPAWTKIRDAIYDAVVAASELAPENVIWAFQGENQPPVTYIDMRISGVSNPGQDGIEATTDLTRTRGREVKLTVVGYREGMLQIEVFTDTTVTGNDSGADALAVVEKMRSALILPSIDDRLASLGVSFPDLSEPAQYIPTIIRANFRGRASWDVRVWLPAIPASEYTGFIEHVSGAITASPPTGGPIVVDFDEP